MPDDLLSETIQNMVASPMTDEEFGRMLRPDKFLASSDCREGAAYWVSARSIGEVAICGGMAKPGISFVGLREKLGSYFLFAEYHYDDNESFGTLRPFLELGPGPDTDDEQQIMEWLVEQEIEVTETRLTWLKQMPEGYKQSPMYPYIMETESGVLSGLLEIKNEGFRPRLHAAR